MTQPGRFRYDSQTTYFYISDLGMHLRLFDKGADAFVSSLVDGRAVRGVEVSWLERHGWIRRANPFPMHCMSPNVFGGRTSGTWKFQITIDDPKVYTKPWQVKEQVSLMLNSDVIESACENNLGI